MLEELRLEHTEHIVAVFNLARELEQLLAEVAERQILRWHERRRSAAEAGCFREADVAHAGERGDALAKRVEPGELRLHLAQLDRHRIQILLHECAAVLGFGLLRRGHQAMQRG